MEAITGAKGGSQKQHTPVEQPDSAQSMARCRMLLALGEGEFAGGLDATSIFLDGTPLGNADGTMNFENVSWEFRPGTQTQTPIPGFPAVENETTVGVSLTKATPWTRALSNTQIDAVLVRIGIPGLQQQENDGDIVGTTVKYHIDLAVDGGAFSTVMTRTVTEKLSSLYELTHRINLPKASTGWQIRVVRDTDDSTSQMLQNKTQVQAITEVIDARLRYPHTALLYVSFNAKSFNNIPKVSCKPKGRIIRIPSNYDPIARTYSGTWDGTFKWGWTNNPAWIWFDVLTEPRFGLGRRVTAQMLDKWELYRIAQRCDQKVPDGKGGDGTEPRFMFDVYIQSQADAWQVIKDIAAGFNGMTFWGNNMFNVVSDMPADTSKLQILTRASVVGKPVYSSGSEKTRFSSALINFSDPDNHYQDRTTAVMFPDLVKQFKFKQTQITAIGCTRESEAQRRGGWAVYSNSLDRIITLQTGLDGYVYVPGTVFAFADERLSGRVYGGRITGYNAGLKAVTTDRGTSAVAGDTLMIRTQGGTVESRVIQAVNGTQLVVATPFTAAPLPNAVFVIDAGQLRLQYFRVTNLRFDDEENTFTITGAEYNASKYDAVDNNARLDTPPISLIPTGLVNQPTNIAVSSYDAVRQGQRVATLTASWDAPVDKNGKPQADVIAYRVQWKRGDNEWVNVPETGLRNIEVPGIFEGDYLVRVRAINSGGASSLWATSTLTNLKGRAGEVPKPVGLKASEDVVFGINVTWGFPANTGDTLSTELQYSITADGSNPMLLASVPYPQKLYQQMGLKAGQEFWYQARLVDRIGNQSGWTDWVRGQASIDVSDITDAILEDMKGSDTFKDLIENAVDSNEKIAGMADDIKQANDELAQQAQEIAKNAQDIGKVQTSVTNLSSTVGNVSSSLSELEQTVATADTALGQRIDNISVSVDGMTGGVKNSAIAIIQGNLAQVAARKTLSASVAGNSAQLDRIDEVIVNEKEVTARSLLSLQTDVNGNKASINSLNQTFSDYQQATATQINGITATINGHTSAITTNAQAIANVNGDLKAMYSIKVGLSSNGQLYAAGMGIGVENTPSGMQSQVIFLADRFAVTHQAGATVTLPFVIQNGQVFIRDALIGDGTISNAKIGNYIQSNNYVAGSVGWRLDKGGTFENYGSTAGEGSMKQTNQTISVRDSRNVLRVQIGRITGTW
ncbi:host specificity protein [Enterobacter hormaechei subsp. xiangfangensis]|uniref:host specificity protein J n=1 Tax=Enterobacter hormaechei TaxID=158836 RepID=UPI000574CF16|nr:phage tail protein [Enterobacter hormaechei]ALA03233.1 host specificity protein [Enterobacter hormaechei subsp. xiangfangensis]ELC6466442.1 phage tail protein [Enterobacter hormaechei]KJO09885.1 host specificity protein [Enterobacter hormaechei subsp. xiangfangensis]KJO77012.1 host specificity protein [Enterobacter hormaechei subsp. xiangfangensis]KJP29515.1 host specificity protein [Enterobacter hormaechei subsp. xiangfangensis]